MKINRKMRRAAGSRKGGLETIQSRYETIKHAAIERIHGDVAEVITKDAYYRCFICCLEVCCSRFKEISKKDGRAAMVDKLFLEEMQKLKKDEPNSFDYVKYIKEKFDIDTDHFESEGKNESKV